MEQNNQNTETNSSAGSQESISFLKIDALKKGSHAMSLLLKTNDIIVGLDKEPFRGTQKTLTQKLKEKPTTVLTILRKESFFNILAKGPLGIKLIETGSDEDITILEKVKSYLKSIDSFDNYKEFEVFRGRNNIYNVIEVNENSLFASLFPLVWLFHYKLYIPLVLVICYFSYWEQLNGGYCYLHG